MTMPPHLVSFLVGFLSLGVETLWARTYAYASQSTSTSLSIVLGIYLLGIARGASWGGKLCRSSTRLSEVAALSIAAGSAIVALSPAAIALAPRSTLVFLPLILLPATLYAVCFPICHHLGTKIGTGEVGKSLSRVYAANIMGCVLGPLVVNFVLLEWVTTETTFLAVGTAGMAVAGALLVASDARPAYLRGATAGTAVGVAVLMAAALVPGRPNLLVARLSFGDGPIRHVVETRQGIVVARKDDAKGDIVSGGNVYDGRTNLDPRINSNGINRIVVLSALAPNPKRVLVIGLSVGSWQHIIGGFPGVEHMDVIEINPGYLALARNYDAQSAAIEDPRVRLIFGDGRKFLRQNPDARYDLIVMNTTWHWRMYVSLLLSREFLTLARSHLSTDGILAFNTTWSPDALKTAKAVFPHAYLYDNFAIAGFADWRKVLATPVARQRLRAIKPAGRPLFTDGDDDVIADYLDPRRLQDIDQIERSAGRPAEVITDRNLITEYRYGKR